MLTWWNDLECKAKALTAVLALLVAFTAVVIGMEDRYAKAADMRMQQQTLEKGLTDLKVGQLQSERRGLAKEKFDLEFARQQAGKLTALESQRLRHIEAEIADLDQEITRLRKAQAQ
jgi:hypothetical protein